MKMEKERFCKYHIQHKFDLLPEFCQNCPDWAVSFAKHLDSQRQATFV